MTPNRPWAALVAALAAVLLAGCEDGQKAADTGEDPGDTSSLDTGEPETGRVDTGDSGETDTGGGDTGTEDTGEPDTAWDTADTGAAYPPAVEFDLAGADAKLTGEAAWDTYNFFSMSVAGPGDIDGDGYADLLIGLAGYGGVEHDAGATYLVRGPVRGAHGLSSADARLLGQSYYAMSGASVAGAGDVDGDGWLDVVVGAPNVGSQDDAGRAYLVRGPFSGDVSLDAADATFEGELVDYGRTVDQSHTGASVAGAGDVDGDGFDDVLVGAYLYDWGRGAAYVVHGPVSGTVDLATAETRILGDKSAGYVELGQDVASAGDVNGDGLADILVSVPGNSTLLLFYGDAAGALGPADADAEFLDTTAPLGRPRSAGDADGDGYLDLWIAAPADDEAATNAGAAFLLHGPFVGAFDETAAAAKLLGTAESEYAGFGMANPGDVDGDGRDDVLLGAPTNDGPGAAYLVYAPFAGTRSMANADVKLVGEGDDQAGSAVAGPGDVDGDGLGDLLIAGAGDDDGGEDAGAAWVVYAASLP